MPLAADEHPLATLLAHTDSRYWLVTLQPRARGERDSRRWTLPADWLQGQVIHPRDHVAIDDCLRPLLSGGTGSVICEYRARSEQNEWRWFRLRAERDSAPPDSATGPQLHLWTSEITRQKRAEQLLELQSRIVQQLAAGEKLAVVLEELAAGIEANYFGASVSILGVAPDGQTLRHLAAPSLPPHVAAQIDGLPIGPQVGACGSAAALGKRVIISDVRVDPRMRGFEDLARETGIRSVWSQPILGGTGEVLGTFAIYRLQVHEPKEEELELLVLAANLAALAMENHRRIEFLSHSEERFRELAEKARFVPWEAEFGEDRYVYIGPQAEEIFGYPLAQWYEPRFWHQIVHPDEREQLLEVFRSRLNDNEHFESEYRIIAADGRIVWVRDFITIFRQPGKPIRLRGYLLDVTRRKEAEEAQRASEALLKAVMDSLPVRLWASDREGRIILQNPISLAQFGDVTGMLAAEMDMPPAIANQHQSFVERALAGEVVRAEIEHDFLGSDQVDQCLIAPIHLGQEIIGVVGCDINVTEQRQMERRLHASENQLRTLLQFAPDLILQARRDTTIVYCNHVPPPATPDQIIGSRCIDWVAAGYRPIVEGAFEQAFEAGLPCHYEALSTITPTGPTWWSVHLAPIIDGARIESCIMIARDITRRKEMEQAIQDRDERFRQLAEATDQGFWLIELNPERLLYVNPAFARIWGLPQDAFFSAPRVGESRIVPEDRGRIREHFNDWLADLRTSYNVEYRIQRPDGQQRWVHDHGAKIFDSHGKLYRVSGIVRDVTEQKRAEAILRESEVRYRLLAENSSDLIMRLNRQGVCLYASPASRLLLGLEPHEIKNERLFEELVHPDDAARLADLKRIFADGGKSTEFTARFRHASGEYRSLDLQAKVVADPTLVGNAAAEQAHELLLTVRDATDRITAARKLRQREADLAHADRMSTMGQMAAELAHELNQPLYAIANFAKASLGALPAPEPTAAESEVKPGIEKARGWLTDIDQQARRAADVIRRINMFVRKGEMDPSLFNLTECVRTLEPLLEVAARAHDATIRYDLAEPLPDIRADRLLIEQVIVNLVRNASEALEDVPAGERVIVIRTYREGTGAGLAVSDTGWGLRADTKERLFEPYFTTKESGTGMGLAICRSTIEAHQGKIFAERNPQPGPDGRHGAQFRVWLPVIE
jgi:PAS domain S-box-containing protein